jgi:hypothetical protein
MVTEMVSEDQPEVEIFVLRKHPFPRVTKLIFPITGSLGKVRGISIA